MLYAAADYRRAEIVMNQYFVSTTDEKCSTYISTNGPILIHRFTQD